MRVLQANRKPEISDSDFVGCRVDKYVLAFYVSVDNWVRLLAVQEVESLQNLSAPVLDNPQLGFLDLLEVSVLGGGAAKFHVGICMHCVAIHSALREPRAGGRNAGPRMWACRQPGEETRRHLKKWIKIF